MRKTTLLLAALIAAAIGSTAQAAQKKPTPTYEEVAACYGKDGTMSNPERLGACLEKELAFVKAEHQDASERVAAIAKVKDKAQHVRTRWNLIVQAGQRFDSFVNRECEFAGMMTKGNRRAEKNGELACRINYYRMRTNVLENRFLSEGR